jgi:hypothetical protein
MKPLCLLHSLLVLRRPSVPCPVTLQAKIELFHLRDLFILI